MPEPAKKTYEGPDGLGDRQGRDRSGLPDLRRAAEFGAAMGEESKDGETPYLALKLDDPGFDMVEQVPADTAIYASCDHACSNPFVQKIKILENMDPPKY